MKTAALDIFVCPGCKGTLDLRTVARDGREVLEDSLTCRGCGAEYAVTRGVPRFVDRSAYAASFGFQWNWFRTVQLDSVNGTAESERTLYNTTGWTGEDYRGRLVLDAGVGAGRFAEIVAKKGGQVVGVDLTTAVDAAYAKVGRSDRVHLAHADIFAMPFRGGKFDVAVSLGLLHHTPHPRDTFDSYTPRYQWKLLYPEVFRWFKECGFGEIEIFDEAIRMRGTKAGPSVIPSRSVSTVEIVHAGGIRRGVERGNGDDSD